MNNDDNTQCKGETMKSKKDIGLFTKLLLIFLTSLQKNALKSGSVNIYMFITSVHFRLFFGKKLQDEFAKDSKEFKLALERHSRMVASVAFPQSNNIKRIKKLAKISFIKNLALNVRL
jgi:hypothetical protein